MTKKNCRISNLDIILINNRLDALEKAFKDLCEKLGFGDKE